jgi:TatD DNase family protein
LEEAEAIIKQGFLLGIGGVLTYKNAGVSAVVEKLPLENMVLETDAPYLTPVPHRGKRNESAYIKMIAEKIAIIKGISLDKVAEITTNNAEKLFEQNIPKL